MILITNGRLVTEDGILTGYDLYIEGDEIKGVVKKGTLTPEEGWELVDVNDAIVAPGFVDIHADYIEQMAAPRPTSMFDFNICIREVEKILINSGITTMFHSLSLCGEDEFMSKPIRYSENVKRLVDIIDRAHNSQHLIRHRFHARLEIDNLKEVDSLKQYIKDNKVHMLSFMDHSPGQGQYRDLEVYRRTIKGYRRLSEDKIEELIENSRQKERITTETLAEIAELAAERGIALASHDDDSIEKLELVKGFGTSISEFPITLEVARRASQMGMHVIAGAPNVLLGGSHSGNLSAAEAIINNTVDILCSDYYPAALLHGVFILHRKYHQDLAKMFNLVTINPARAVKLDHLIGSIKEGKKADLLIIEELEEEFPVITGVYVDGKLVSKTNYRR